VSPPPPLLPVALLVQPLCAHYISQTMVAAECLSRWMGAADPPAEHPSRQLLCIVGASTADVSNDDERFAVVLRY
jgi:hypothetical protein